MNKKEYVIARLTIKGKKFEILVDAEKAYMFKEGKKVSIHDIVTSEYIYKDAKKGLKASPEELIQTFNTTDIEKIAEKILREGEVQLTTEQRRQMIESKKKQIIYYISKSAIDPKTKLPIPISRIEKAIEEAKVAIDPYKSVEEQVPIIVKSLTKIMPIRFAKALLGISIPPEYASKASTHIMKLGEVKKHTWTSDGSLLIELEIPAGMQNEVIDSINRLTKGSANIKVIVIE